MNQSPQLLVGMVQKFQSHIETAPISRQHAGLFAAECVEHHFCRSHVLTRTVMDFVRNEFLLFFMILLSPPRQAI